MKKLTSLVIAAILVFALFACGKAEEAPKVSVACLKGPTGVGMAKLMSENEEDITMNDYSFTVASAADEISGKIVSGEINIASVPTNLAAKLYNKTEGKIRMLAVNTLGVLSVIENGDTVKSVSDLKGKTVWSTGEGSNPEYILRYVLEENGLVPGEDVELRFIATNDELVAALVSGSAEIAMVPEPAATTVLSKKETLTRVLNINDEWEKITGDGLMMGCVVALDSYVGNNAQAVDDFLTEYEGSIKFANESTADAASLCEKYGIIPSAAVAEKAIPECNVTFATGNEMKAQIEKYFEVLLNADPTSVGGKLPGDDFYYGTK